MSLMSVIRRNRGESNDPAKVNQPGNVAPAAEERATSTEGTMPNNTTGSSTTSESTRTEPAGTPSAAPPSPPATPAASATPPGASTEPTPAAVPATFAELAARFADDPAFIVEAQQRNYTLSQAYEAHGARMRERLAKLEAENAGLRKLGTAGVAGAAPVGTGQGNAGAAAAGEDYEAEVNRVMKAENLPRHKAVSRVNAERPDLRVKYVKKSLPSA